MHQRQEFLARAGIVSCDGEHFLTHKGMGLVSQVFGGNVLDGLLGRMAIGHTRYSTTGSSHLRNAQPLTVEGVSLGNRFCILPMEGWDGTADGRPSELTIRRWQRFGQSGAKLIWGGEAMAVREDGRANPNQIIIDESK